MFNERYAPGAMVAIAGVAVHAKHETWLRFHVFTEDVHAETIGSLRDTLRRIHANGEIVQHVCDEDVLRGLPVWAGSRMSAVRCRYPHLMPDVEWCLHLDCDVLYLASVEEHFEQRDESVFACVTKEEGKNTNRGECAWIREHVWVDGKPLEIDEERYFNAGVMLMNLKKMRDDGIAEKLLDFFRHHPDVPSPDQDALNVALCGLVKMLPRRFNQSQLTLTDERLRACPIIHYVSGNPWLPQLMCVANHRFWLWHAFADRHVWCQRGESVRRCFEWWRLTIKCLCYWLLVCPLVGWLFALTLEKLGFIKEGLSWRDSQVGNDISSSAVEDEK